MKTKYIKLFQTFIYGILFLIVPTVCATAQITDVQPRRVTIGSVVTITGTGFNSSNAAARVNGTTSGVKFISRSSTQVVFEVTAQFTTPSGNAEVSIYNDTTLFSTFAGGNLQYIAPVTKNNTNNIRINKIYTDYDHNGNGIWESSSTSTTLADQPNTRHNLLAFEYNGQTYSTKANDALLTSKGITFNSEYYRAFSTRGVLGKTHGNLFIGMADLIDGTAHNATGNPNSPELSGLTCYDVLVDGINGLDLGTGVTNFNTQTTVHFSSENIQTGPSDSYFTDNVPDVVFTQIADPSGSDVYFFVDNIGNVVGTPIRITMDNFTAIGRYRLDLFRFQNNELPVETATIYANRGVDRRDRDIRMVGLRFSDFNINASNYNQVQSLSMAAGGGADLAFMAYNTKSFSIPAPHVVSAPNPVYICELPYSNDVQFTVNAGVDGGGSTLGLIYTWKKNNSASAITANPSKYVITSSDGTSTLTVKGPITASELATYKVEISNTHGAIVAASAVLRQGGLAATWDGSSWNRLPNATSSLIFTADYDSASDLSGAELYGCDCTVNNNVNVVIDSNDTLIIQNAVKVAAFQPAYNEKITNEVTGLPETIYHSAQPAGTLTIKNNGSLVQINEVAINEGVITYQREATTLNNYDYIYWSSPVANFSVSNLPNSNRYKWNPTVHNANNTYGNWVGASGTMDVGLGYIARISNPSTITVNFTGEPNNGVITKTISGIANADTNTNYWNLLGNPYPSPINAEEFLKTNTTIEGTVRLWSHGTAIGSHSNPFYHNFAQNYNTNDYITYNATATIPAGAFNGYIASGQGFFVKGITSSGTVTFNNLFRHNDKNAPFDNSQFFRQGRQSHEKSVIWLSLINSSNNSNANIAVGYVEGATFEKDRLYDSRYGEIEELSFYSIIDSDPMLIQGRPAPFEDTDMVKLGLTTPANTMYTIAIDQVSGVFEEGQEIYLEDNFLNIVHDLRSTPYSFTSVAGTFNNRFNIVYRNQALGIKDQTADNTFAFISNNTLQIKANEELQSVTVFDITGKEIMTYNLSNSYNKDFSTDFNFSKSVYLAQIKFKNGNLVTRKLVN